MSGLVLDEEQVMLAQTARQAVDQHSPLSRRRVLRDQGLRVDAELWGRLVELGWSALVVPEELGGLGMGLPEAVLLMEALGRNLAVTPMLSAVMCAALDRTGATAEGRIVSLAWREDPVGFDAETLVTRYADGGLTGRKLAVLDGTHAEGFVVSALDAGVPALFHVSADAARVRPLDRVDQRDAAEVHFDKAPAERLPGGLAELRAALDRGCVALAAEQLGAGRGALERTLAYLHQREQFGVPIGSFQVLQHRAVDCFIALELAHSTVLGASRDPTPAHVSLAKASCNDALHRVSREAIQLHGGIGMTDEHDIGFFIKWAQVAAVTLGDSAWHRDRWAREAGY